MPLHSRVVSKDEELGKKDDDFKPKRQSSLSNGFNILRWRKRRLLTLLAGLAIVYLFIHNIPEDFGPIDPRLERPQQPEAPPLPDSRASSRGPPTGAPPRPKRSSTQGDQYYYDGPIKFYNLASSLHGISRTMGSKPTNRNVLFAGSSLKSVANLLPMACDMARFDRNYVHLALMGRDSMPTKEIMDINGITKSDCEISFHDARGDYSEYSTETRLEVAVAGAMKHINEFMHPQAVITDDSSAEDAAFTRAMRAKSKELGHPVIEIPRGGYEDFLWITRLDSGSLASWFKPKIDILVHAPQGSSGGLIKLLKSLEGADYTGLRFPRLTVELPSAIDHFTRDYLRDLRWPPTDTRTPIDDSTLTLRHRIPSQHATSEQASLRFLESFYPASPEDNHVLVISPQVELSRQYLQYLHYQLLEYRYSSYGAPNADELLGIALDVPSKFINGTGPFTPPKIGDMNARKYKNDETLKKSSPSPFLYQAPDSSASLIFGDKWTTFHDFLSHRLAASHSGKAEKAKKLVSETEPAWMEFLLELMRLRNWSILHPSTNFATVHNELVQLPEEYNRAQAESQKGAEGLKQSNHPEEEAFLTAADEQPAIEKHVERAHVEGGLPLHELLLFNGDLPELPHVPFLSWDGDFSNLSSAATAAESLVPYFRHNIGACDATEAKRKRVLHVKQTDDLFCLPGVEMEFDDASAEDEEKVAAAIAKATESDEPDAETTQKATVETKGEVADEETSAGKE